MATSNPILNILQTMVQKKASDLHFRTGKHPIMRINGELVTSTFPLVSKAGMEKIAKYFSQSEKKFNKFVEEKELDIAFEEKGIARFRINLFFEKGNIGCVIRHVPINIPSFKELSLPPVIKDIASNERGLVLVTGTTGSGKSTTLAAMVDYINHHFKKHIVTIEDPIEFLHEDALSVITQREVGIDTKDFHNSLKYALRQDPDVILVGEMRDEETVGAAISAAETGHLVFGTLHTINSLQTINRIIDFFPPAHQEQIRIQLAFTLKAVISMRLLPRIDIESRVPALEIMIVNENIKELMQDKHKIPEIADAMKNGQQYGMQTFDQHLIKLFQKHIISEDTAKQNANSPADLALAIKGYSVQGGAEGSASSNPNKEISQEFGDDTESDFTD
ncbi:type IV pilus twitching motility protein PilT [bacterium]|nr:type IV pilus twitching motility protein PilT [bacterium]